MAMHTWFECKIRYEKVMENGMQKKVTEPYLVDALSFTEAEARIIEEMTPFITGEFTVSDIKRANYSELFASDEEMMMSCFSVGSYAKPPVRLYMPSVSYPLYTFSHWSGSAKNVRLADSTEAFTTQPVWYSFV